MSGLTRRGVLAGLATGTAGLAAPATAQPGGITTEAVVPESEAFSTDDYTGFFVHLTGAGGPEPDDTVDQCSVADWDPDDPDVYEAQLVDDAGEDSRSTSTTVYANAETELETGSLFVVNTQHDCPGDFVGLELEELLASGIEPSFGERPGEPTSAIGPGFGPVAALTGLTAGALALWRGASAE